MDDNRVSPMEERALANAIERAATVASIDKDLDCNVVLANQLKKASIDPKFAKTASQAFNKRLTVLTFQKTADEHKADSFPLTDADTVYRLVTNGEAPTIAKAASFDMAIEGTMEGCMEKAASERAAQPNLYEKRVSMDTFHEHLECMMDQYADAFKKLASISEKLEETIDREAEEVAAIFKSANYDYDFTTAVNLYGDKLKAALGHKLDKEASFEPTSKFVIKPQKAVFDKVARLLSDVESLEAITEFEHDYATGLTEFCKSAAALAEEWQLKKVAATPIADQRSVVQHLSDEADEYASRVTNSGRFQSKLIGAVDTAGGMLGAGLESGIKGINDITGAARAALGNARALYAAGNNVSISPGDLLDAAFLTKDRYRDRLLAWSDMSADPQLAMYPAEQVFQATNKAMDMDTSLERPDQREVLRAQVAQLLAQNNRVSTADIAALAATLKALSGTRPNAAVAGDAAVSTLADKTAPERPALEKIVGEYGSTEGLHDFIAATEKDYDKRVSDLEKIDDRAREDAKKQLEEKKKERDAAKADLKSITDAQIKQLMNLVGYHAQINPRTHQLEFAPNKGRSGRTLHSVADMQRLLTDAINSMSAAGGAPEREAIQGAEEQLKLR